MAWKMVEKYVLRSRWSMFFLGENEKESEAHFDFARCKVRELTLFINAFAKAKLVFLYDVEGWIDDLVAHLNRSHPRRHKSHTDVLDNISGRKRKVSHLL